MPSDFVSCPNCSVSLPQANLELHLVECEKSEVSSTGRTESSSKRRKGKEKIIACAEREVEKECPICKEELIEELGGPDRCKHSFCLECIIGWSEVSVYFCKWFLRKVGQIC